MKVSNNTCKIIKLCNISLSLVIILFLYFSIVNLLKYSFMFVDDVNLSWFYSLKSIFINSEYSNGLIIPSVLEKLLGTYIPYNIFKIHPSDFKSEYFSYIEAILLIIFCIIPIKIMFLNKHENIINKFPIIIYLFIITFYFYSLQEPMLMIYTYDGLFRLNMPIFLFLILFYNLIKISNKVTLKDYIIISFLALLSCISNEPICIMTFFGTFIYILLSLLNKISNKKIYYLLTTLIFSIIGVILLIKTGAFTRKTPDLELNLNYFKSILHSLPFFTKEYIKHIILKHFIGYIILIFQILILFIKTKERDSINIVLSYLSGILIFFFSLIGLGQYGYSNVENTFWIIHPDIKTIYDMILLSFNLYLFSVIIKNNIFKDYIYNIVLIILTITSGFFIYKNTIYYNDITQNFLKQMKQTHYQTEKIIRLANLKKKTIYIDCELYNNNYNWALFYNAEDRQKNIIYPNNLYIRFLNSFNGNITQKVIYVDKETADKEFKANGGILTNKELEDIKFSRLLNNDFILNKN